MSGSPLDGRRPGRLAGLPRRIYLTLRYRGVRALIYQTLVFPLRLTPLGRLLGLGSGPGREARLARSWYREHGRPVTIVVPSYRDAKLVARLVAAIRRTTDRTRVRIIVADDASGPEHRAALSRIEGIEVVRGESNRGFSANVNRGLTAAGPDADVVLLNSDVVPTRDWLGCLQHAAYSGSGAGVVAARLLYPDNRIQYAGTIRNARAPEWFDHRYRFKDADWGPANVAGPTLAATAAAMYLTAEARREIGDFDEALPMGYEDVDYGLRAWNSGQRVLYAPAAVFHHQESATRGRAFGERERESQRAFWAKWGELLDGPRSVTGADGRVQIIYVIQETIVGGGARLVFEHLNHLASRGHDVALWTLGGPPDWFELRCPVRVFSDFDSLERALTPLHAIKVATWWNTAAAVWRASVVNGRGVYYVQDIETSYYADDPDARHAVLASYRPELAYVTESGWNREQLAEIEIDAELVLPGVDHDTFRPRPEIERRADVVLAIGRSNPLKNLDLTLRAWRRLPEPRPELCLFGIEPELAREPGITYVTAPSDERVAELYSRATVFVQTSSHEGFCLPALEAMACGTALVCTDAHGNRDFCIDGVNCLMPAADPDAVAAALRRALMDPQLRERLGDGGTRTASEYRWEARIDALERFLLQSAQRPGPTGPRPPSAPSG
jgi:glycosyltransferase involved in cell wall biosynthesis